jgi:hypothetical protein
MIKKQTSFTLVDLISLISFISLVFVGGYLLYLVFELLTVVIDYLKANS